MPVTQVKANQLKDNDITDVDIAAANKDGANATPSLRTLGTNAGQAADGTAVILKDGSVAFTGNQSLGNHLLTNVTDPASLQDAATKNYVDTTAGASGQVNKQTGVTYTYVTADRGKLVTHTNALAIAAVLPQAGASFPATWYMDVQNRGSGVLTITPVISTIDGAATLVLQSTDGVRIFSDGTNYYTQRGISRGGAAVGSGYATIQDEGISQPAQTTLNFIGAIVTVTDDSGNSRTNVTMAPFGTTSGTIFEGNDSRIAQTTGYIYGFALAYASSTTVTVSPPDFGVSACRDKSDVTTLRLAAVKTITITTHGAINGDDSFVGTGTTSTGGSSTTSVTGTSTTFLTSFGIRALSGTISSSTTAVTGTATKFTTEIARGDLIGTVGKGYYQVAFITDDTHLTIESAPGTAFGSDLPNCIENPTYQATGQSTVQVTKITSNTAMVTSTAQTYSAGTAYRIGTTLKKASQPVGDQGFMYVWVGNGASGTDVYISTQRTTPYGITGYNTYIRRIASVLINTELIAPFNQYGLSNERRIGYELAFGQASTRIVSAATGITEWTYIASASAVAPPFAQILLAATTVLFSAGGVVSFRLPGSNISDPGKIRIVRVFCPTADGGSNDLVQLFCSRAQAFEFVGTNGNGVLVLYIDIFGYLEML